MRRTLKRILVHVLSRPAVRRVVGLARGERVTVFMLHRFADPATGHPGLSPVELGRGLELLRREGYRFVSLDAVFRRVAGDGPPLGDAVAFTVDDGYRDQAEIGAPLFLAHDCPVTIFLTTGFLDGTVVPWWDRIEWVFRSTRRRILEFELNGRRVRYMWRNAGEREVAQRALTETCKGVPDGEKHAAIQRLVEAADVAPPDRPFGPYVPMSWADARALEARGVTFGPHTVNHPILSMASEGKAEAEIRDSWRRLREELRRPLPVFCFPNGRPEDFGAREIATLEELGFVGAVTTRGDYADLGVLRRVPEARYTVGRFGISNDPVSLLRYASGAELLLRRLQRPWDRGAPGSARGRPSSASPS